MKRSVTTDTEEIKEILASVGECDKSALKGFLIDVNVVLASGEAKGKYSVYGAAAEVVIDEDFSDFLPFARSLIVWIGARNAALRDLQWLFAAIFRKTNEYCDTKVLLTEGKRYANMSKVVIVAK